MFQQTIQEIKFEDIILSKKQQQAKRTNKLRHWLEYLNMLDENKSFKKKNQVIQDLHKKFILRQQFWLRQINRTFQSSIKTTINDIQFCFLSLEDGFYQKAAKILNNKLFQCFNKQELRPNYIIAKLQLLISKFNHLSYLCSIFFQTLRNIYIKTNDIKKIKQIYKRQIQQGFNDFDVVHQMYRVWLNGIKNNNQIIKDNQWIEDEQEKLTELFQKGKSKWEYRVKYIQEDLPRYVLSDQILPQGDQKYFNNQIQVRLGLLYLQNINSSFIDQQKYLKLLSLLSSDTDRLFYLRRLALSQSHQLVQQYLYLLQKISISSSQPQLLATTFKNTFTWQNSSKYQLLYLQHLIRKINLHLNTPQSQQYNNSWSSNVQFFRIQISQLIQKKRFSQEEQIKLRELYYNVWIDVQNEIVKDVESVKEIFQSYLAWGHNQQIYFKYAKCMLKMGDIKKARFIYNKTCETYNYSEEAIKQYSKFVQIYGALQESIKLNKKIKQIAPKKANKNIIIHKTNNNMSKQIQKKQQQHQKQDKKEKSNTKKVAEFQIVQQQQNLNIKKAQKQPKNITLTQQISQLPQQAYQPIPQPQILLQPSQKISQSEQTPSFKRLSPAQCQQLPQIQHNPIKRIHTDQKNTLFLKNIKKRWNEQDIQNKLKYKNQIKQIRLIGKQDKKVGYIQYKNDQYAEKQLNQNKQLELYYSKPPSKSDNTTLFVCNLPCKVNKKQIIDLIPQNYHNLIKDIRIKQKNDKTMAYIQFQQEKTKDDLLKILKKDKIKLHDKYIIFKNCQSDNQSINKKIKTIFLKNLSFKCNADDIRHFFEQKGFSTINEIFIPKQQNNKPKGFAYVEFRSSQQCEKTIQLKKGTILKRQFTIHKSDRSITHENKNKKEEETQTKTGSANKSDKKSNSFFKNMF